MHKKHEINTRDYYVEKFSECYKQLLCYYNMSNEYHKLSLINSFNSTKYVDASSIIAFA